MPSVTAAVVHGAGVPVIVAPFSVAAVNRQRDTYHPELAEARYG
jgi:hypothetical protein